MQVDGTTVSSNEAECEITQIPVVIKDGTQVTATNTLTYGEKLGKLILESAVFSAVDDTPFDLLYPVYVYENPDGTGKSTMIEPGKILMDDTDGEKTSV